VVTSPPYEGTNVGNGDGEAELARLRAKLGTGVLGSVNAHVARRGALTPHENANLGGYGTAPGQVGALRQETYWSAMKIIWEQAFLALRPNGVLCCVIKDFVRAKKRVPLCDQTWRLLLSLGFQPVERIRCLLSEETREPSLFGGVEVKKRSRQSFFRRLATKKGAPDIPWEEILVVRRPPAGVPE
jgi:hypothetical protein